MITDIIKRYVCGNLIESIFQKGRPKLLKGVKIVIVRKIKENTGLSAPKLTTELYKEIDKDTLIQFAER